MTVDPAIGDTSARGHLVVRQDLHTDRDDAVRLLIQEPVPEGIVVRVAWTGAVRGVSSRDLGQVEAAVVVDVYIHLHHVVFFRPRLAVERIREGRATGLVVGDARAGARVVGHRRVVGIQCAVETHGRLIGAEDLQVIRREAPVAVIGSRR